jgi:hypothetical protein
MLKVALYARYSTDNQRVASIEDLSLPERQYRAYQAPPEDAEWNMPAGGRSPARQVRKSGHVQCVAEDETFPASRSLQANGVRIELFVVLR